MADRPAVGSQAADGLDGSGRPLGPEDVGVGRLFWRVAEAVVAADLQSGRIVLWNPAAQRMFGYTAEEAVGQPIALLVPERFAELHRTGLARYRETGQGRIVDAVHPIAVAARPSSARC